MLAEIVREGAAHYEASKSVFGVHLTADAYVAAGCPVIEARARRMELAALFALFDCFFS